MEEPILQFFSYQHLPQGPLQDASRPFCDLAHIVVNNYPRNPERTVALRKLLEAKDAAVRAVLYKHPPKEDWGQNSSMGRMGKSPGAD
jgi:hypothetical protein